MTFRTELLRGILNDEGGIASGNRFRVQLPSLSGIQKPDGTTATDVVRREDLRELCTAAKIPGKQINTVDRMIGLEQIKVANGFVLSEVNLTFYLTNDYSARRYFQEWMDCIVSPKPPFEAGFHSNYANSVTIMQLDKKGNTVYTAELIKAYPTSMTEIDLNNQAQTSALELTVNFTYSNYLIK